MCSSDLPRFLETDQKIKHRDKEGRPVTYGELLEQADPKLAHMTAPDHLVARQNVARAAARRLREAVTAAKLDALIIFGDDQYENFKTDCVPAFYVGIYDHVVSKPYDGGYIPFKTSENAWGLPADTELHMDGHYEDRKSTRLNSSH